MDNDRFQEVVLEHLAHITQEITGLISDVTGLKSDVTEIKSDVTGLKSDVSGLKSDVSEIKSDITGLKSDVIELKTGQKILMAQVAELVEFRSEATRKLDQVIDDVHYLKYKESQNEADLFKLKKHLQIIK